MSDDNERLLEAPSSSSSAEADWTELRKTRFRRRSSDSSGLISIGTSLLLLLLCFYLIAAVVGVKREEPLYKKTDPILELDVATFNSTVYNKPTAFVIEFYSSWCGHCIDYVPYYVEFGKLLKPWSSVVVVAALNCADELNAPVCRSHEIDAFPTLKYFKLWSKDKSQSEIYTGKKKDLIGLSLFVADWLKRDYDTAESRPVTWPRYDMTPAQTSLSDLWTNVADPMASLLCVVVENSPAHNGFALITNYAAEKRVYVAVVEPSHPISQRFGGVTVPAIHIFRRKNPEEVVYSSNSEVMWKDMKEQIDELLISEPSLNQQQIPQPALNNGNVPVSPADHQPSVVAKWNQFEVQLLDIQSALRYMLTQEIPRRPLIAGSELSALTIWIRMLRNYAPGSAPLRRLFYRLDEWLVKRAAGGSPIKAEDWLLAVESTQNELGRPLPSNTSFMACRGSQPYLRGYTCGLWTLFHAVTVQAYKQEKDNVHFKPHIDVLNPIHQFVVQFLSCEVCAKNFNKMAAERAIQEARRPEDVVLWLWRAHNAVNRRLSGEKSDDPLFPKQQFPPVALCADCRRSAAMLDGGEPDFDESKSLQFLIKYYSDIKMDGVQITADYQMKEFAHGQLEKVADRRLNPKFAGMAGKVDNLEELEARLNNAHMDNSGPKRQWKMLSGLDGSIDAQSADRTTFYLIWLVIVALILGFVYMKYRQNRSKFWKTFYYYNDYKL